MQTSNERILDLYIKHQTYLLRYVEGLSNDVNGVIKSTESELEGLILKYLVKISDIGPLTKQASKEYKELLKLVKELRYTAWDQIIPIILSDMKELAQVEADTAQHILETSLPVVINFTPMSASVISNIVNTIPYDGFTASEWLHNEKKSDAIRIVKAVKSGLVNGTPLTQIVKSVVGTPIDKSKARQTLNHVRNIVRTVANGVASQARNEFYKANSDIIQEELFVATLDGRTTPLCAKTDQRIFKLGEGLIPPLHFGCRSIRVPYINPENLRNRGFDSSTQKQLLREFCERENMKVVKRYSDLPRGFKTRYNTFAQKRKRELVGQVPADLSFANWLKQQTHEFQNEYLGIRRAKLYRSGDLPLSRFISRDGDFYTLAELRKKGMDVPSLTD